MTTLTFPPVPRPAASEVVQRSSATISDAEFSRLGIGKNEAQRAVYKAIKGQRLKYEASVARAAGLNETVSTKALNNLMHLNLVRRGVSQLGGLFGDFEIIEKR